MTNLSSFSMINERVKKYKNDFNLENYGVAFAWLALEVILSLNTDEIEDAITDGSYDGGIDAIYINDKEVHIFSFKYTDNFENTKKNFPENDLNNLIVTIESIFEQSVDKDLVNSALWEKICEIWELLKSSTLKFKYYICSNKLKPVETARKKFEGALNKYHFVEFYYIEQEDFAAKLLESKYKKVDGNIRFIDKQYFERSDGPLKGIVATVAASDLIKLVQDLDDASKINESAFNDNVRIYFKQKNKINEGIYNTALSELNYEFWYLNNGITIVCGECSYQPNSRTPWVELKNFQIVNGGQTTHALFEAYTADKNKIDDVSVLVRICQTRDTSISEKISETTNKQTPVLSRDLHSNDSIQKKLEDEFKTLGFFYERKKNQYADEPRSERLDSELLGQLSLAYDLDMPADAKNNKALVFGKNYDDIFNDSTTALALLKVYQIYKPIEEKKKEIKKKQRNRLQVDDRYVFIIWGTFHILNSVKVVAEEENISLDTDANRNKAIEKAVEYIADIVQRKSRRKDFAYDRFFKESANSKLINKEIRKIYRNR